MCKCNRRSGETSPAESLRCFGGSETLERDRNQRRVEEAREWLRAEAGRVAKAGQSGYLYVRAEFVRGRIIGVSAEKELNWTDGQWKA